MKWTPERIAWFTEYVPGHSEREISAEHERVFGVPLTEPQIGNAKTRFHVKSGTHGGRFVKGQTSWNKGRRWSDFMPPESQERSRATCFKRGNLPHNALRNPIGTEHVDSKDGYVWVKIAEHKTDSRSAHDNWRQKHHLVWERANGRPVPPHTMIVFADRDKRNFDPANIVAVPRDLWGVISRQHLAYHDAESLRTCMSVARLQREMNAKRKRPRECKSCGTEFEPRFANQKTCDACLGREVD